MNIRPFEERDRDALAAVARDAYKVSVSAERLRAEDEQRDPTCFRRCWVVELNGRVVAYSLCAQHPGAYHPRRFEWEPGVLSAYRGRGIGSMLLTHLQQVMQPYNPIAFSSGAREDWPDSVAFLERHGFQETMRNFESRLHLPAFDPAAFAGAVRAAEAQGYTFQMYSDLVAGTPDLDHQLYELVAEIRRDVPSPEPRTDIPEELWIASRLHRPQFLPDLHLIAFKDGHLVGVTMMWATDEGPEVLDTGLTGVRREHRGHGVSKAIKVMILAAAKARGARLVRTWNEVHNQRMLAVNAWLGFARKPGWIAYQLTVGQE